MKKWIIVFLFILGAGYSQPARIENPVRLSYVVSSIDKDEIKLIYFYKIPFKRLVFIKDDNKFVCSFEFLIEYSQNNKITRRGIKEEVIISADYNQTLGDSIYTGFFTDSLSTGDYSVNARINFQNTKKTLVFNPVGLNLKNLQETRPLISHKGNIFLVDNRIVPFCSDSLEIYFTLDMKNSDLSKLRLIQNREMMQELNLKYEGMGELQLEIFGKQIILQKTVGNKHLYSAKGFNLKLNAEPVVIEIWDNDKNILKSLFSVEWIDKPRVLNDLDFSLKLLEIIENKEVKIPSGTSQEKYIRDYWKKFDPTPNSEYNEIMAEFYNRADYALRNFGFIGSDNISDRAKIFIKYGIPVKIERKYNNRNEIYELWVYKNIQFYFKDISGTGNFELVN